MDIYLINVTWRNHVLILICSWYKQASSQALPGALATQLEKEGELATTSLEFEFHLQSPSGLRPRHQISTNQRKAETSENVNKNWKTCAKSHDAINYQCHLRQSAFRIDFFEADIQIPNT